MNTENLPLVSVIIPMYNAQDWITGLLESILNQTYQNIEIILVDDGSTDSSAAIVSMFSQHQTEVKLRVVTQENKGVSEARNEGVRQSLGELLAFVDSDDIWMAEKIERQVAEILSQKASAVACGYAIFRDSDRKVLDLVHPTWSLNGVRNWLLFRSYGGLLSSTLMIRKEAFLLAGPFRRDLSLSADIEFAWRLLQVTPVVLVDLPLVGYRLRPNQMHKQTTLLLAESERMIEIVEILKAGKYRRIFLSNLNLRLFLYRAKDGDLSAGWDFLKVALQANPREVFRTIFGISLLRTRRKFKFLERKPFLLPPE